MKFARFGIVAKAASLAAFCALTAGAALAQSPTEDKQTAGAVAPEESSPANEKAKPRPKMGLKVPLTAPKASKKATSSQAALKPSPYKNTQGTEKAQHYYSDVWGVDHLRVSSTNSNNLIKFSYRVLEPKRAKTLGEHENTPELIGIRSNAVLHIPTMEKIGQLRQMSAAEPNKDYWMVFSNKGSLIKKGDEVNIIIGKFRADGLIVE